MLSWQHDYVMTKIHIYYCTTGRPASAYVCPVEKIEPIDTSSKAEDKRIKDAVAMYKKEISKRESSRKELKDS